MKNNKKYKIFRDEKFIKNMITMKNTKITWNEKI